MPDSASLLQALIGAEAHIAFYFISGMKVAEPVFPCQVSALLVSTLVYHCSAALPYQL